MDEIQSVKFKKADVDPVVYLENNLSVQRNTLPVGQGTYPVERKIKREEIRINRIPETPDKDEVPVVEFKRPQRKSNASSVDDRKNSFKGNESDTSSVNTVGDEKECGPPIHSSTEEIQPYVNNENNDNFELEEPYVHVLSRSTKYPYSDVRRNYLPDIMVDWKVWIIFAVVFFFLFSFFYYCRVVEQDEKILLLLSEQGVCQSLKTLKVNHLTLKTMQYLTKNTLKTLKKETYFRIYRLY